MAVEGRQKYIESSSSWSRDCIDAIERHSVGMGMQKAKKFFRLGGKAKNLGLCRQKTNNQTYSDLVYDALYRPQCDIGDQNSHGCNSRLGGDWKKTLGSR